MKTASEAYKAIIASTFPELNRSISDGITPNAFGLCREWERLGHENLGLAWA
jgi:hypothetical protein